MIVSVLIFTSIGMSVLFKLGVRINTVEVDTGDTAHLEYYEVRQYIKDTGSYRIFIDGSIPESYEAVLDFLKFVKQNADIGTIRLERGNPDILNAYLESGDSALLPESGLDETKLVFIRAVYSYNMKLPPQKRVSFAVGGKCGATGEFVLTEHTYDRSEQIAGLLDISCIYPGNIDCDPLFDIRVDKLRFGSLKKLNWYADFLGTVSGNFGMPEYSGINQPEFYFIWPNRFRAGVERIF
jgi:hypothetical protein